VKPINPLATTPFGPSVCVLWGVLCQSLALCSVPLCMLCVLMSNHSVSRPCAVVDTTWPPVTPPPMMLCVPPDTPPPPVLPCPPPSRHCSAQRWRTRTPTKWHVAWASRSSSQVCGDMKGQGCWEVLWSLHVC
jgi:hypothetical protein